MARINIFENIPTGHFLALSQHNAITRLQFQYVYLTGSISFNTVAIIASQGHTSASASFSLGLYSLNGATFSLANSASNSFNLAANGVSWVTLATSATQDITPGEWWFAFMSSTAGQNSISLYMSPKISGNQAFRSGAQGGPFFRGLTATSALPSSIATSTPQKEGANVQVEDTEQTYVLISA